MNYLVNILLSFSFLISYGQKISIQNKLKIIAEEIGDLDNDEIDEKVIVYETNGDEPRELHIFKYEDREWIEWIKTSNVVRKSTEGGLMGDPFEGIGIKNNVLSVHFSGGSNWRWTYTDNYKYQNNQFELISYKHSNFKMCDDWDSFDFNLSNGKIILKNGYERCKQRSQKIYTQQSETFFQKRIVITFENRKDNKIKIVSPKGKIAYLY